MHPEPVVPPHSAGHPVDHDLLVWIVLSPVRVEQVSTPTLPPVRAICSRRREASLQDLFNDLGVALATLYLHRKGYTERAFCLATQCVLFADGTIDERRSNHVALCKAYRSSSTAVRAGKEMDSVANRELLKKVSRLCKSGIICITMTGFRISPLTYPWALHFPGPYQTLGPHRR